MYIYRPCVCVCVLWNALVADVRVGSCSQCQAWPLPVVSDGTRDVTTSSCEGVSLLMRCLLDVLVCACAYMNKVDNLQEVGQRSSCPLVPNKHCCRNIMKPVICCD